MKNLLLILLLILVNSCKTSQKAIKTIPDDDSKKELPEINTCGDFFTYLEKNWVKNNSENCYKVDEELLSIIKAKTDCFYGMTRNQIQEILGSRSEIHFMELYYDFHPDCNSKNNEKYSYRIRFYIETNPDPKFISGCQVIKWNDK